ncbi:MAG TPA: rod shape-determining protein RodA [Casimicrobium sp.]|jgi:rod shape determining protein RodA|nr:rod shape-determining protein RodA [Casimicrobium sp.]HPT55589.1 rod shape-determining protein RodA [Casimicrobium sp.]
MIQQIWSRLTDRLDPFLFAIVTAIAALGLLVLFSATNEMLSRVVSQSQKVVIAVAIMIFIANLSPQFIARFAVPLYVIGIVLLVGVAVGGEVVKGARRWLKIPGVGNIQPSEIMKIALPLILAWYFERHEGAMNWRNYAVAAILVAIPFGLVYRQPDLGTALLIGASGCFVLYLAGLDWRIIVVGSILAALAFAAAWHFDWLHDYQKERVLNFLSPDQDVQDAGWHTVQAAIAIGSGGVFGKGWLQGTQTHLEFLPEKHTDFIFAVYGEEFGLLGGVVLIVLYLLFIGRCFLIAANASTLFGRLMAGSMTLMFFTYAFVNIGMVTGMLPVVGVPLPFMSFGGTALMTLFIAVGILMSVQTHRKLVNS